MIKIENLTISKKKKCFLMLSNILGIGFTRAYYILSCLNINLNKNFNSLSLNEIESINNFLNKIEKTIDIELQQKTKINIKNKITNFSFQGYKHKQKLPVRGQRTRTNSKTTKRLRK